METLEILKAQEAELLREISLIEKKLREIKLQRQLNQLFRVNGNGNGKDS